MKMGTANKTIEEAVRRELGRDPAVTANGIGVTANEGAVVLTGNAPSNGARLAAVRAAQRIKGVGAVSDEIEVQPPAASPGSDAEIAETILRQLRANIRVPDTIKVDVRHGFVTLRGTVESSYQRDATERAIVDVQGVYAVRNLITIKPRAKCRAA
jgi:osmotically-inducible protein OsmY